VADTLVFQSMLRGSNETSQLRRDYDFHEIEQFVDPSYPAMYFVEDRYAGDPTNWWIPNRACAEAMLRRGGSSSSTIRKTRYSSAAARRADCVIEAVVIWADSLRPAHGSTARCGRSSRST